MKIKLMSLFVAFYVIFLVSNLPASIALGALPNNLPVQAKSVTGTLWQGQAGLLTVEHRYQFKQLTWRVDWLALLSLTLQLDVTFNNGRHAMSGKGIIAYSLSGISAKDFILDIPAQQLLSYLPLPVPVSATGDIALVIKEASQGSPYCGQLDANVAWQHGAVSSQLGNLKLGQTNIHLSCKKGALNALVKQTSDQLQTHARAQLMQGERYQLNGTIQAKEKLDPAIKQALSWVGPKNNKGATVLKLHGKL